MRRTVEPYISLPTFLSNPDYLEEKGRRRVQGDWGGTSDFFKFNTEQGEKNR